MPILSNLSTLGLNAMHAPLIALLSPGLVPVFNSAPILTIGMTYSASGINAADPSLLVTMQFLAELTNGRGGIWLNGTQHQVQLIVADDQSSANYMQLLYSALEQELGIQLFIAPYGDQFIQHLSAHMAASNGTFVVGVGSDPVNYIGNTGNLFDFINTSDLLLRKSLDLVNTAAQNTALHSRGISTICAFTATVDPLLRAQHDGLLSWMETENARRKAGASGGISEPDLVHLAADVAWPDSSDTATYASYYSLCPDGSDLVVALASGHAHITGLAASYRRPNAMIGWTSDPLVAPGFKFVPGGIEHSFNQKITDAAGWLIPVPVDTPELITLPAQVLSNAFELPPLFAAYTAALNVSAVISTAAGTYIQSWCTLMAAINSSASLSRDDMRQAVLSLNGLISQSGLLQINTTTGVNDALSGVVVQCDDATTCWFRSMQSPPIFPYDWPWHVILPGDPIFSSQNPSPVLVALVIAVLGTWVAQILLEQASFIRRKGGLSFLLWLIIAAVALGGVGIWCCMLMQTTAMTTSLPGADSSQPVQWSLGVILLALCPSLALVFLGLWLLLADVSNDQLLSIRSSSGTSTRPSLELKASATKLGTSFSQNQLVRQLMSLLTWRVIAGVGLFGSSITLTRVTLWYVWQQDAVVRSVAFAWAASTVTDLVLIPLSTLMLIRALRWKIPAIFLFAGSVMADWQIHASSLQFTYQPSGACAVSSPCLSVAVVLVIAGSIAAFACFVFVGLQFHAMKLSRNDLSLRLNDFQTALFSQQSLNRRLQEQGKRQLRGALVLSRMLNAINLLTTLPQEYSLPLSFLSDTPWLSASEEQHNAAGHLSRKLSSRAHTSSSSASSCATTSNVLAYEFATKSSATAGLTVNKIGPAPSYSKRRSKSRTGLPIPGRVDDQFYASVGDKGIEGRIVDVLVAQHDYTQLKLGSQNAEADTILGRSAHASLGRTSRSSEHKSEEGGFELTAPLLGVNGIGLTVPSPTLETIMSHPVAVEVLKRVLNKNQSVESLIFCLHARWYRRLNSSKARGLLADRIVGTFIRTGSSDEININTRQRNNILSTLLKTNDERCPSTLFLEAEQECINLITSNLWNTFVATADYRLCAWICSYLDINVAFEAYAVDMPPAENIDGATPKNPEQTRMNLSTFSQAMGKRDSEPEDK